MTVTQTTSTTITVATTTYVTVKLTGVSELMNTELGDWSVEIELGDRWIEAVVGMSVIVLLEGAVIINFLCE